MKIIGILFLSLLVAETVAYGKGSLTYLQFQRLNTPNNPGKVNSWIGVDFQDDWTIEKYKGETYADFSVRHYPQGENTIFSLSEAYFKKERGNTTTIFGRQILDWAPQEAFWGVGQLNSLEGFSHLSEKREGLVGARMIRKMWGGELSLFASMLYVPQLNPGYIFKDGEMIGQNEWVKMPPTNIMFREGNAAVKYNLITPDIGDLLVRESYGLHFRKKLSKLEVSLYGIVKPENTLRAGAYGHYEQGSVEAAKMRVRGYSINHQVYGGMLQFPILDLNVQLAVMNVVPDITFEDDFEPESYENYQFETDLYEQKHYFVSLNYESDYGEFSLNYISSQQNLLQKGESDAGESILGGEMKWENAIGFNFGYKFYENLNLKAKLQVDLNRTDKIFTSELHYKISDFAHVSAGIEILESPDDDSFWSTFRSNDASYAKFSYVF